MATRGCIDRIAFRCPPADSKTGVTRGTAKRLAEHLGVDETQVIHQAAGLGYDTKFDLRQAVDLPFATDWFPVPPAAPHGQTPKLGTLHSSLVRAVQAASRAVSD